MLLATALPAGAQSGGGVAARAGSPTSPVDVTDNSVSGTFSADRPVFQYTPTDQAVSLNRTQNLVQFNSAHPATTAESALVVNATSSTGFARSYGNSTKYARDDYIDVNGNVYKVTVAGTSAATGSGPSGTGASIANGSMVVAFQCPNACNGKFPFFVSHQVKAGAGHVWGGAIDMVLGNGYQGNFATTLELDATNHSEAAQPNTNILFISGLAGSHPVQYGISIASASPDNFMLHDGIAFGGARAIRNAAIHSFDGAPYLLLDNGTHNWGAYFDGAYANGAIYAKGRSAFGTASTQGTTLTIGGAAGNREGTGLDQGQVFISPVADSGLLLGYRYQAGVAEYGRIQARNAVGATALVLNGGGGTVVVGSGQLQIAVRTVATLPPCNAANNGLLGYVTDARAPAWNAVLAGGGSKKVLALCNGADWTAH